jgi:hypothetical protein
MLKKGDKNVFILYNMVNLDGIDEFISKKSNDSKKYFPTPGGK